MMIINTPENIIQVKDIGNCKFYGIAVASAFFEQSFLDAREAFRKQQEENEQGWGLVLVMPKEVEEASQHLGNKEFNARSQRDISREEYAKGYYTGKEFDPTKRLAGDLILPMNVIILLKKNMRYFFQEINH